jgi:hypothetical protein
MMASFISFGHNLAPWSILGKVGRFDAYEIINTFCKEKSLELIDLSKKDIKSIFSNMEPDLIAYDKVKKVLHIGEITTSGYYGHKNKDFHLGATKNVFEAFSRFYIFLKNEEFSNQIKNKIIDFKPEILVNKIECHFVVPEGSRFIKALGYRGMLLNAGIMSLNQVNLSDKTKRIMKQVLQNSKKEMLKKKK